MPEIRVVGYIALGEGNQDRHADSAADRGNQQRIGDDA